MSKKRTNSAGKTPVADAPGALAYIAEDLRPLAVPIGDLVTDPANALKHTEKDIGATAASLRVYGQRTPIVVNKLTNIVLKGNGTLAGAKVNGWSHLAVVWVKDDPATAAGYSIADNRTGRLAGWDKDAVDRLLRTVQTSDEDLAGVFDELAQELDIVPGDAGGSGGSAKGKKSGGTIEQKWQVVIDCKDEEHQLELLERFETEGIEAKPLTL